MRSLLTQCIYKFHVPVLSFSPSFSHSAISKCGSNSAPFVHNAEAFYEWETILHGSLVFLHVLWEAPTKLPLNYFFIRRYSYNKQPRMIYFLPLEQRKNMVTLHYKIFGVPSSGFSSVMQPIGYMHAPSWPIWMTTRHPYLVVRGTDSLMLMLIVFTLLWVIKSCVSNPGILGPLLTFSDPRILSVQSAYIKLR